MNTLLGYTKSASYAPGQQIKLYTHFPSVFEWDNLYKIIRPNQGVGITKSYGLIACVINQLTSTPGVLIPEIIPSPQTNIMIVRYDISSSIPIHPFVRDLSGNVLYWIGQNKNLIKSGTGVLYIRLGSSPLNVPNKINLYLLAPKGTFTLGSKFVITNLSVDFVNLSESINIDSFGLQVSLFDHKKNLISTQQLDAPPTQKFEPNSFANGCKWTRPGFVQIAPNTKSGYYFLKLSYRSRIYWLAIIIKPDFSSAKNRPKILMLSNTNKFNAYNTWAGLDGSISLYTFVSTPYYLENRVLANEGTDGTKPGAPVVANFVHMERPNTTASSYIQTYWKSDIKTQQFFNDHIYGEMHLPNYLDSLGLEFDVITDQDMETLTPSDLSGYSIFMMHVHPEYWSEAQVQVLSQMSRAKINLMYLAGNGIYWKCTWVGNQMEVRKDRKLHLDGTKGGQYKELGNLGEQIIKIYYSKMYNMSTNPPVPYKLISPPEWMLEQVDISGGFIGFKNLNSRALMSGTSGWEVDNVQIVSNTKYIIGSSSDKLGQMIWKDSDSLGGAVFSAGSVVYTGSLNIDSGIANLTKNVINKMLG
jgi:hypothetical protein